MLRVLDAKGRKKSHFQRKAQSLNEKLGQSIALVSSVTGKRESRIEFQSHSEGGLAGFSVPDSCAVLRWPEIPRPEILAHSAFLARTEVGQECIIGLGAVPFQSEDPSRAIVCCLSPHSRGM